MPPKAPEQPSWRQHLLDLPTLVANHDPHAALPWVAEPLVIDGMLAIVAGKGGTGKTWVAHESADAVARGLVKAGMQGHGPKPVLIIDAEMGEWLTTDRFQSQGYCTDPSLMHVFNAVGMDLKKDADRQMIWDAAVAILGPAGGLLIIDSLRAICPTAKENDSDDMGPVVTWLRKLCRQTNAGGVLLHHAGWREARTRGSSAIKDQADVVWYLSSTDDGDEGVLRLTCRGSDLKPPRWGRPPKDLYMRFGENGGLVAAGEPEDAGEAFTARVIQVFHDAEEKDEPISSLRQVCDAVGVAPGNNRVKTIVQQLTRAGQLVKSGANYRLVQAVVEESPTI